MTNSRVSGWLAGLPLVYLVVFFLVPTGLIAAYSFLERDYYGQVFHRYSSEGWEQASDHLTRPILLRSFLLALGVTGVCLLLGYPCALTLARLGTRWKQLGVLLITFPLITSLLLRVYGWMNVLPLSWRGTLEVVGLVLVVNFLPFMVLPLLRACERIDPALPLAAMDLGATPWQTFWRVTWPLTRSGRWAGCLLVFIPACGEYLVPHFLGQGKVTVLGTLIVQQFMERRNWPYAAACAVWLIALVVVPSLLAAWLRTEPPDARADERD